MSRAEPRTAAPLVTGQSAVVSAGHELAASTAMRVLQAGGNAGDAAVAASAVQCVVEFPWCGVAGDTFVLVRAPDGETTALNGSGPAPAAIDDRFGPGERVPRFGPMSVAVPGTPAAWVAVAEQYGSWSLDRLLTDAVEYAAAGFPLYPRLAAAVGRLGVADDRELFEALTAGNRLEPGAPFRQPDLAGSLAALGEGGRAEFYAGRTAERIVDHLARGGGVLSAADLADHTVAWIDPVSVTYRGWTVSTQPPVSMGCLLLAELAVLEHFDVSALAPGSPDHVDLLVGAMQAAFQAVLPGLGEGNGSAAAFRPDDVDQWVARIREGSVRIDSGAELAFPVGDDTTSLAVTDPSGMTVALVHSLFNEFGSRVLVPGTGLILNDRLANLSPDPSRPNGLRGGRRPIHTLHSYVAAGPDGSVVAGATPGGRGQVQTNLQVLVNVVDHGDDVQRAVERPRWVSGRPRRSPPDETLYLEPGFEPGVETELARRGHQVQLLDERGEDNFGCCTVVAVDGASNRRSAAVDHRRGAAGLGW